MYIARAFVAVLLCVALTSLPGSAEQGGSPQVSAVQGDLQAVLAGINATFGTEDWKYNPNYFRNGFAGPEELQSHIENETASYQSALGYRVRVHVKIVDSLTGEDVDDANVNITAFIDAPGGRIRPFVTRGTSGGVMGQGGQPTNDFFLDFDVDGSIGGGPRGGTMPPLQSTLQRITVEIFEQGTLPGSDRLPRGQNQVSFLYDVPSVTASVDFPRPVQRRLPDSMFRLYNDMGWGSHVDAVDVPIGLATPVTATFRYTQSGQAGEMVQLLAFEARRQTGTQDGGSVQVLSTLVDEKPMDANGTVRFAFAASDFMSRAGVAVLAAQTASTPVPPGTILGGPNVRVGAQELVLFVVGDAQYTTPPQVIAMQVQSTSEQLRQANRLQVRVVDPLGQALGPGSTGDAVALAERDGMSSAVATAPIQSDTDPGRAAQHRVATLPTNEIQNPEQAVARYRVMALLYTSNDYLYALATADRGYGVSVSAPLAYVGQPTDFFVNVTSWTTNYNDRQESGLSIPVKVRVEADVLGINETRTVTLAEGATESIRLPVTTESVGTFPVRIVSWTDDTADVVAEHTIRVARPAEEKGLLGRVPGFEGAIALVGAVAALILARRRP